MRLVRGLRGQAYDQNQFVNWLGDCVDPARREEQQMSDPMRLFGLPADARAAILHVDDVGMCHGANVAYLELFRTGAVDSGSVMVPCPWFAEIAAEAQRDRALDLGVHLTLTSEWEGYRWRAISTINPASGLLDDDGFLPRNCSKLRARLVLEAAELEMRTQIDRALGAGIDATHLDAHMGAALIPELLPVTLKLGREYRLPVVLPRDLYSYIGVLKLGAIDPEPYAQAVAELAKEGLPMVDHFRMTPGVPSEQSESAYRDLLTSLPPGITFVSLHCNAPGDIETIVPPRASWRTDEYRLFASGKTRVWMNEAGIRPLSYRRIRDIHRAVRACAGR
jgi:chitin disaccharide deacetylase